MRKVAMGLFVAAFLTACSGAPPRPAALDTRNDACGTCRMVVSDARFAAQIVAPGEEPVFFDDIGCLSSYLDSHATLPAGAVAFVTDHRASEWARADAAAFTRVPSLETPMGSHIIAHATEASRDADPAARGGEPVRRTDVLRSVAEVTAR